MTNSSPGTARSSGEEAGVAGRTVEGGTHHLDRPFRHGQLCARAFGRHGLVPDAADVPVLIDVHLHDLVEV
jgi:hypothetical protein